MDDSSDQFRVLNRCAFFVPMTVPFLMTEVGGLVMQNVEVVE